MQNIFRALVVAIVPISFVGCGVEVTSGSDTEVVIEPRDTVQYQIYRTDDYGYVEQSISRGCIYLDPGEEENVLVEDQDILIDYEFNYRVRGDHLVVGIYEDGSQLHRSYHRTDLFHGGYTVEQKVISDFGVSYLMTLEDVGCS